MDSSESWKTIQEAIQPKAKYIPTKSISKKRIYLQWGIAAAIISFLSLTFYFYSLNPDQKCKTQTAIHKKQNINLVDNSKVELKLGASLTYPEKFSDQRIVKLRGTAFFDIQRDEKHPFIIETQNARVEVLGTSFLVKSDKDKTEVIVKTGRVSLSNQEKGEIILKVGDKGILNKEKIEKSRNTDPNFLSWKTKELVFEENNLEYVINKINESYHTKIAFQDSSLKKILLSAQFKNMELEEVMKVISETLDLNIEKNKEGYWIVH